MNKEEKFMDLCQELEKDIQNAYEEGVTLETAERYAAKFLAAQIKVSMRLQNADLDSRMRKNGIKTLRATLYLDICSKVEKKPTEAQIEATLNADEIVGNEQTSYDSAEVVKAGLERYYDIFKEAHIYFRGIAKGRFE